MSLARPSQPAFDRSLWRIVGDPLMPGVGSALRGESVAVKDLFAVAGQRRGAGNPAWLAEAPVETESAWAVSRLLHSGADLRGIARTDEFAYSLAGQNVHYGCPPNPAAPDRLPGGSSSGSAAAVALGQASIGLGTDTGGSIRVPAAYQGLWGLRTTHGVVPRDGLLPLAPSFDTVGWLTRDLGVMEAVAAVLLPVSEITETGPLIVDDHLLELADPAVAEAIRQALGDRAAHIELNLEALPEWLAAFQTLQAYEAWRAHGAWLASRLHTLGPDIRARFERASRVSATEGEAAADLVAHLREGLRSRLGERVLVLPSASSPPPRRGDGPALQAAREHTMMLTCLAGLGGLPALNVPLRDAQGLPVGLCLVGPAGSDRVLIARARQFAQGGSPRGAN